MKTLPSTPEQPRHRNTASWTTASEGGSGGNYINDGAGNSRIDWRAIDAKQ